MPSHGGLLPREGFHADVLGQLLENTILNPLLTGPLLLFAGYTRRGQDLLSRFPHSSFTSPSPRSLVSVLKWLTAFGALRVANAWLTRRSLNNFVSDKYDWDKELVLITGGADGIGGEMARQLCERGVKVVVLDVQALAYEKPNLLTYIRCDIASPESLSSAAAAIAQAHPGQHPTVLILNAGICRGKPILSTSDADVRTTFSVNAISHYAMMREFLPALVAANHGMVVTVASTAAWITAPQMTEYAASKAAALAFHEGLAAELVSEYKAPRVRSVIVNQGYTRTKLFEGFGVGKSFFGPALEVATVAERIVEQVVKGESAQIVLPGIYKGVGRNFRSLPGWMQHLGRCGSAGLMKDWKGRQVQAGVTKSESPAER